MANTLSRQEVKRLALIGAQQRLDQLRAEIATIVKAFPELGRGSAKRAIAAVESADAGSRVRRKRNWKMSADQKKAVSERMRKYWAARRKEKGK